MKINQKGFGVVEVILILVILGIVGFVGWRVYDSSRQSDVSLQQAQRVAQNTPVIPAESPAKPSDDEQIMSLAKQQCEADGTKQWAGWQGRTKALEYSSDKIFAKAATACTPKNDPSAGGNGYELVFKKQDGEWKIIYRGTDHRTKAWGEQHGAPQDWYESGL